MRISIASDHAGFELKAALLVFLKDEGHRVEDLGPFEMNPQDDYPDFCIPLAKKVAADTELLGIVIGLTGEGEAIACNRVKGARAAVYYGLPREVLELSREHNNANILSLGAKFLSVEEAKAAVREWLSTGFSADARHVRRIEKLDHAS